MQLALLLFAVIEDFNKVELLLILSMLCDFCIFRRQIVKDF